LYDNGNFICTPRHLLPRIISTTLTVMQAPKFWDSYKNQIFKTKRPQKHKNTKIILTWKKELE